MHTARIIFAAAQSLEHAPRLASPPSSWLTGEALLFGPDIYSAIEGLTKIADSHTVLSLSLSVAQQVFICTVIFRTH